MPDRRAGAGGLPLGVAYDLASLSCTLPIFMAVVGGTLIADGLLAAVLPLLRYALGMGAVLSWRSRSPPPYRPRP